MEGNSKEDTTTRRVTQKSIRVPAALHSLLNYGKKIAEVTTYCEILDALKFYILKKRLFDNSNPGLIHCKNDELGNIFGVSEFTVPEVEDLLPKVLFADNTTSSCEANIVSDTLTSDSSREVVRYETSNKSKETVSDTTKRKLNEVGIESSKKMCIHTHTYAQESCVKIPSSPMFLSLPAPTTYDSSSESNLSVQGYETMIVKDTSDDLWYLDESEDNENIIAIREMYNLEYEVETDSNSCKDNESDGDTDTDSDVENAIQAAILSLVCKTDSDVEFWADQSSEEDFDFDAEISEFDRWKCTKCKSLNDPPMRYCLKCWDERIGWLPEKRIERRCPKRKTIKYNKDKLHAKVCVQDSSVDSASAIPGSSQESTKPDLEVSSQDSSINSSAEVQDTKKLCTICYDRPLDATIVHGKIGHMMSCYNCAKKLQRRNQPCPICRRAIYRVIHLITI